MFSGTPEAVAAFVIRCLIRRQYVGDTPKFWGSCVRAKRVALNYANLHVLPYALSIILPIVQSIVVNKLVCCPSMHFAHVSA